jgi:hypothetical protein
MERAAARLFLADEPGPEVEGTNGKLPSALDVLGTLMERGSESYRNDGKDRGGPKLELRLTQEPED